MLELLLQRGFDLIEFTDPVEFRYAYELRYRDLWDRGDSIAHVEMAHATELFVVAPATAHTIARLALGMADDVVTATILASPAPVLVAPGQDGLLAWRVGRAIGIQVDRAYFP